MTTTLFAVGICIFMITVHGTVIAGGAAMKRQLEENLDPGMEVVDDDGWEVLTTSTTEVEESRSDTGPE